MVSRSAAAVQEQKPAGWPSSPGCIPVSASLCGREEALGAMLSRIPWGVKMAPTLTAKAWETPAAETLSKGLRSSVYGRLVMLSRWELTVD